MYKDNKDECIITIPKEKAKQREVVRISGAAYAEITFLQKETGKTKRVLVDELLNFALERVKLVVEGE